MLLLGEGQSAAQLLARGDGKNIVAVLLCIWPFGTARKGDGCGLSFLMEARVVCGFLSTVGWHGVGLTLRVGVGIDE